MSGDEGGGLDEVDAGGSESRDDPSVWFPVWCFTQYWRGIGWGRFLWRWRGRTDEAHQRSRSHSRDRVEAWTPLLMHPANVIPPSLHPDRVNVVFRRGAIRGPSWLFGGKAATIGITSLKNS